MIQDMLTWLKSPDVILDNEEDMAILLRQIVDAEVPWLQVDEVDNQFTGTGALDLDGIHSLRISISFAPANGLLRVDARLGRLVDPTPQQAQGLLGLGTGLCWCYRDPDDGDVFIRAAALAPDLNAAQFALRALVWEMHVALQPDGLPEALSVLMAKKRTEATS